MYPSFFHFLFVWKLKEANLFAFWSNTPSFFDANMFLVMPPKPCFGELGSGLNRNPPFMNKAYGIRQA